jgi:murein DD-endopeptidase MepM/ murein hydrolase activator NlpD
MGFVKSLLRSAMIACVVVPSICGGSAAASVAQPKPRTVPYRTPIASGLTVLTTFAPPATRYGRGHLGVDVAAATGSDVSAAGAGQVRFAGMVAGRGVVVIAHPDGLSTEYEPVTVAVRRGDRVRAGQRIGQVAGGHRSCAPASCLHWGARRGEQYLNPLQLLQPLGVVRLLPWSDSGRGRPGS